MKTTRGFTLVELIIVVAILGVISAIAIPVYRGYLKSSEESAAKQNIANVRVFEDNYRLDHPAYAAIDYTAKSGTSDANLTQALGGAPSGDKDVFNYKVEACATDADGNPGTLANCYTVTVSGYNGQVNESYTKK